jgi:hypothetical protein
VIRLTDEHGDVLLDTGEKSDLSKDVDSNGNTKDYRSGLSQRRRYKTGEKRNDERGVNDVVSEAAVLGKCSEQKQKPTLPKNLSVKEGERLTVSDRYRREEALEAKRSWCKSRRTQCLHSSLHAVGEQKSQSEGCISSQCKEKSRNKVHRRRRNQRRSSMSSDSSPEVRRRTRHRSRAKGRTAVVGVAWYKICVA